MQNSNLNHRVEAYRRGSLSPTEREAFEAALKNDAALQRAYVRQSLQAEEPVPDSDLVDPGVRAAVEAVRRRVGPLPEPTLTWLDHLRYWLRRPLYQGLGLAGLLLVVALALPGPRHTIQQLFQTETPAPKLVERFYAEPFCAGVAGESSSLQESYARFEAASNFYCFPKQGGLDSLNRAAEACGPDFCMAHYYRAHWNLKHGNYPAAETELRRCLEHTDYIRQFRETSDLGNLRLNYALARLGAGAPADSVRPDLTALAADADAGQVYRDAATALLKAL